MNFKTCPKCLAVGTVMIPKLNGQKGFEYVECNLCEGKGEVTSELNDDFLLSLNEDLLETNDDW